MANTNKQTCPTCGQSVNERQIALFSGMVEALYKVWDWCEKKGQFYFERKDIKHLFVDDNQIARFGDWIYFGGLVYKPEGKGSYALDIERVRKFFGGSLEIPTSVWKNPITHQLKAECLRYIYEIPHLGQFLDANQSYIFRYRNPEQRSFL